uniref:Uncharacterized protein n=1 Tax=Tanacetum cinerariifolium TaxID=118510 RepID=A0A6L2MA61_TANCI|nr:hypothetical protein [Tanacetum cinerariifolium]
MIKLRDLGADMPTERGHILGIGRQVAGLGKTSIFSSQPRGTYSQLEIDDMLAERDQAHVAANPQVKAQKRELEELRSVVKSDPRMAELLSQLGSQSEIGLGSRDEDESRSGGGGDDEGRDDDTDGDDDRGINI